MRAPRGPKVAWCWRHDTEVSRVPACALNLAPPRIVLAPPPGPVHYVRHSPSVSAADKAMEDVFSADYVSLHVRVTNRVAYHMYTQTLGYQ